MIDLRLVGGAALLLCIASTAHAQRGRLVNNGSGLRCEIYEDCETAGIECETVHCLSGACVSRTDLEAEYACCGDGAGCPTGSSCDTSGSFDFGICTDESRPTCDHSLAEGCFVGTSWDAGDCDGDDIPNSAEAEGCECESARSTDAPSECRADAGVPMGADAGTSRRDGGANSERDSGSNEDLDASGTKPPHADTLDYRGSGGCTCDAAGSGGEPVWLLLGMAVLLGRRMRRAR